VSQTFSQPGLSQLALHATAVALATLTCAVRLQGQTIATNDFIIHACMLSLKYLIALIHNSNKATTIPQPTSI